MTQRRICTGALAMGDVPDAAKEADPYDLLRDLTGGELCTAAP